MCCDAKISYSHPSCFHHYSSRRTRLHPEIQEDDSLMQYAVKGSDAQWSKLLKDKNIDEPGTIQIQSVRQKRKGVDDDDFEREEGNDKAAKKSKKKKKKGAR